MKVNYGNGKTKYGPGVEIKLTGEEVAKAIYLYLFSQDVKITGPATINVNDDLCRHGKIYMDPSGSVMNKRVRLSGRGPALTRLPADPDLDDYLRDNS